MSVLTYPGAINYMYLPYRPIYGAPGFCLLCTYLWPHKLNVLFSHPILQSTRGQLILILILLFPLKLKTKHI